MVRFRRGVSYPLQRMGVLIFIPSRNKVPLCGGVARSAGVVNAPAQEWKDYNNSSHRSYECPPPPGPAQTKFAWVESRWGVSYFARRGWGTRVTSTYFSVESFPQFMLQYTQPMVCPLGRGVETPSNVFIMNKELQTRVGEW